MSPGRTCGVEGCGRQHKARGYCKIHYERWRTVGNPLAGGPIRKRGKRADGRVCKVEGCGCPFSAKGLCKPHYRRMKAGVPLDKPFRVYVPQTSDTCSVDDCARRPTADGLCGMHWQRWKRGKPMAGPPKWEFNRVCSVPGCGRKHAYGGLCNTHRERLRTTGEVGPAELYSRQRENNGNWKGGRMRTGDGYVRVIPADGDSIGQAMKDTGGRVAEHRLVMANLLGRPLELHENVHHINGVRDDNRPENLELWNTSQPSGQRIPDKQRLAADIVHQYGAGCATDNPEMASWSQRLKAAIGGRNTVVTWRYEDEGDQSV